MQNSLQFKVDQAFERLQKTLAELGPERMARVVVAWTGGKDSTVCLHLWKRFLKHTGISAPLCAINLDTGLKFPEIITFRDELTRAWDIQLFIARPAIDLESYPVAQNKATCCEELKIVPLKNALQELHVPALITGVRRDEHISRQDRPWREEMRDPTHLRLNILLEFTEMDVWAYTMEHGLPRCSLYDQGYRSLGCVPCTCSPENSAEFSDERSGRDADKERVLEQLHSLGYF